MTWPTPSSEGPRPEYRPARPSSRAMRTCAEIRFHQVRSGFSLARSTPGCSHPRPPCSPPGRARQSRVLWYCALAAHIAPPMLRSSGMCCTCARRVGARVSAGSPGCWPRAGRGRSRARAPGGRMPCGGIRHAVGRGGGRARAGAGGRACSRVLATHSGFVTNTVAAPAPAGTGRGVSAAAPSAENLSRPLGAVATEEGEGASGGGAGRQAGCQGERGPPGHSPAAASMLMMWNLCTSDGLCGWPRGSPPVRTFLRPSYTAGGGALRAGAPPQRSGRLQASAAAPAERRAPMRGVGRDFPQRMPIVFVRAKGSHH